MAQTRVEEIMTQDLQAVVADLSARLARLEAERAILDTMHRYAHMLDYGDNEGWLDLFVDDAVWDMRIRDLEKRHGRYHGRGEAHDKGVRFAGQAALRSFIEGHSSAPEAWHKHLLVEPVITLSPDGRSAEVHSFFERIDEHKGQRVIYAFGRYIDQLKLCPDGRWRFKERIVEGESIV
jgi:3-phenylpropionate/cinnamic acid dioxygenase small subunit